MKNLLAIIIILSFVVACKITKVKILKPGEEITFLDIMKNFKLLGVSNDGKTLNIGDKTYNFEKDMGVFFGLYKKENATSGDNDEYIILSLLNENGAAYASFDEKHKNALDKIINEIGEEGWGWAVSTIFEDKDYTAENISNNVKKGKINISEEKIKKIQKIIDNDTTVNSNISSNGKKMFGTLTKIL